MGKSNNNDRFPGSRSHENKCQSNSNNAKPFPQRKSMKTSTYFSDPLLIPRINQYLSDNKDKVYVDINDMVTELQSQYRDYARRKRNAFKPLVERAFSFVLQQCGVNQGNSSMTNYWTNKDSSENSSSEIEECNISDGYEEKSLSNSQLLNLYNTPQTQSNQNQTGSNDNAELIDLSSDDENVKKKDGNEDKVANAAKLNNLQARVMKKETTLTLVKPGIQSQDRTNFPNITITAKRPRESSSNKFQLKMMKKKKLEQLVPKQPVTFSDFGGDPKVLEEVCKLILHISHPEIYRLIGVSAPRGFLLHGPPGCGKTLLATAIAGELDVELLQVSAPELIGGVSGESEERIRDLFDRAVESAPCVLFIDEVDAITPNRQNAQREMERRIVAQLLTCLDELNNRENGDLVLVIGATNRPDSLDPALRRAGRFDREVCLGIPDLKAREKILKVLCSNLNLSSNFSYEELAQNTPGFVGADLLALTREAAMVAVNRVFGMLKTFRIQEKKHKKQKIDNEELRVAKKVKENNEAMEVDITEASEKKNESPANKQFDKIEKTGEEKEKSDEREMVNNNENDDCMEEKKETQMNGEFVNNNAGDEKTKKDAEIRESDMDTTETICEKFNVIEKDVELCKKGANTVEVNDEVDIEVIVDNDTTSPSLETLLYWVRDCSPFTYRPLKNLCITQEDFKQALSSVQPSSKREGFATVPDVTWDDVGSLADVREELKMSILMRLARGVLFRTDTSLIEDKSYISDQNVKIGPVKYRKQFEQLGLSAPAGILICGPPGCGKTLLAKAVANEANINFISVKGPELLNMYVGESERAVRRCFQRARNSSPCVIFFDELDALCPRRSDSPENGATIRVVNQLLTEMDGVEDRKEVFLMAATNRPDIIDPAVLRPGRLDKILYVGLPQAEDRVDILKALTKNGTRPKLAKNVDLREIAFKPECNGYSGADLAALVREAGIQSVKDLMARPEMDSAVEVAVTSEHFERALKKIRPSVSLEDQKYYETIKKKYSSTKT